MSGKETTHDLFGFSYDDRQGLLPGLTTAFTAAGGWLLERTAISPTAMQFRVELQLHAIEDMYAALMGTGIELTRATHARLTELCTCWRYSAGAAHLGQVVTLRLELSFLEDVTLHSLLTTGAALA